MKTTLVIDDQVMRRLKQEAARQKCTMSYLVEAALRLMLDARPQKRPKLSPLPTFNLGALKVDISNRDALYRAMEEDE